MCIMAKAAVCLLSPISQSSDASPVVFYLQLVCSLGLGDRLQFVSLFKLAFLSLLMMMVDRSRWIAHTSKETC